MTLSEPVQLALIGAVVSILSGNLIVSLKNGIKHNTADVKLDNIKTLADGTVTALRTELTAANTRIADLENIIHVLMETKTEFEKEYFRKKQEKLEAQLTERMQENADVRVELTKAKLSPAMKPEDL